MTLDEVKKNMAYKNLPIVTLDKRWYELFPEDKKTPKIRELEKQLNNLIKRQGGITNDLKALKKIKNDMMEQILNNTEDSSLSEAKRQKKMKMNQKLMLEAKDKIIELEQEELELPRNIRQANLELVMEGVEVCYQKIHENYDDIQHIGKVINDIRIELKKKVLLKQDKEIENTYIYSYMHDVLGPEMMEVFDTKTGSDK